MTLCVFKHSEIEFCEIREVTGVKSDVPVGMIMAAETLPDMNSLTKWAKMSHEHDRNSAFVKFQYLNRYAFSDFVVNL